MKYLVVFLVASLLFHPSSSSQGTESCSTPKIADEQRLKNLCLAAGLSQVFKSEKVEVCPTHTPHLLTTDIVPFVFPISTSYDMDFATKLSRGTDMAPQYIFSILVQIIYTLLQFHIKRLFKLDHSEPFIPDPKKDDGVEWEENPQEWFIILLGAIMPGALVIGNNNYRGSLEVNQICVKPFQFLTRGDKLFEYSVRGTGIPKTHTLQCDPEIPTVAVYSLPPHLPDKNPMPDQAIMRTLNLVKSYPSCKEILNHLLQGITFTFDLKHAELNVIVKPTKDIPSVEESRHLLKGLFRAPIGTQIMLPEDVKATLNSRRIPKASCYHPTNTLLGSPDLYERILTLMVEGGIVRTIQRAPDSNIGRVVDSLDYWLKLYLPNSSIRLSKSVKSTSVREVCTYEPEASRMWIYKGDLDGETIDILLELGKPAILNHIQMAALEQGVFPFMQTTSKLENAETSVKQLLKVIVTKLKEPMKTEPDTMSAIPSPSKENKANVLEHPDKSAFSSSAAQGAISDSTLPAGTEIPSANVLYSLDNLSRDYGRNTGSRFESPIVQKKTYQQSRQVSLNGLFNGEVFVEPNADTQPLVKNVLFNMKTFEILMDEVNNVKHYYYVSWYMEYFMPGEGIELIYFPSVPNIPIRNPIRFTEYKKHPMFKEQHVRRITCKYPANGDFSEFKGQVKLRFDAKGQRIMTTGKVVGSPDWPIRLTVMASVLEAIKIVGMNFPDILKHVFSTRAIVQFSMGGPTEIVSYAPHLRQFDLIDTSKPFMYVRYVEKVPEGVTIPIRPVYWKKPNCYLLGVRSADTIVQKGTPSAFVLEADFHTPFEVNHLTSEWIREHGGELTPFVMYSMIELYHFRKSGK